MSAPAACPLCRDSGGEVLWRDALTRVVWPGDPDHPGLLRVVLEAHVAEMTDLSPDACAALMDRVFRVEAALRAVLSPDKMNLASLGNQVPHLHWHVIPRWHDDRHFPGAIWAAPVRTGVRPLPQDFAARVRAALADAG